MFLDLIKYECRVSGRDGGIWKALVAARKERQPAKFMPNLCLSETMMLPLHSLVGDQYQVVVLCTAHCECSISSADGE